MCDLHVTAGDAAFPARLASIPSPPGHVWIRGRAASLPAPQARAIAVVGSRTASRDGLDLARCVAEGLARAGVVVVSGLARGIDGAAHQATVEAGGSTIAVLGSGLNRLYPREHEELASRIAGSGAIVSEYPPNTPPRPGLFPRRNRIIAGLADAVVVVEAPEKSGALITATAALDQGKDVLVLPGRVAGGRNRGGHLLIRDGAKLVESADDILLEMGWLDLRALSPAQGSDRPEVIEFTVDDVARQTGESTAEVLARLLEAELSGDIQRIGSARFVRVRSRMLT